MFDLTGMTALVTGASGGLGTAIAKGLAAQGARLAISGSNAEKLEAFRAELGGDHVALVCNLSDGAEVDGLVPRAVEALGKLDILVNNAGMGFLKSVVDTGLAEWQRLMAVNLESVFLGVRAGIEAMKEKGGTIVNVASIAANVAEPLFPAYNASKAGVAMLTKAVAVDCARKGWPVIDVTRRSIEETAAAILDLLRDHRMKFIAT